MISAAQLRAARGLLDWTRNELAEAAKISPETVKNIEHGVFRPQEQTADAIVRAFRLKNVEFTQDDGVKMKRDALTRYEGPEEFKLFMDDVYEVARHDTASSEGGTKPICVANVDDSLFAKVLGDYSPLHSRRMNELKNVKVRVLVREGDFFTAPESKYIEYRGNPRQNVSDVPFYVYGDKFALIMFNEKPSPSVVVISSAPVANAYREQFEILWQSSTSTTKAAS